MRKIAFAAGEYYHVFNQGVDKRNVIMDAYDVLRFLESMREFNGVRPIGSIFEKRRRAKDRPDRKNPPLVTFIAYCINPNHFHFLLRARTDDGVQKFMQKFGNGYTKYFNERHGRRGSLFQGTYQAALVASNGHLLHVSAYINLNDKIHNVGHLMSDFGAGKLAASSWREYTEAKGDMCASKIILKQFKSRAAYKEFAKDVAQSVRKERCEKYEDVFLEAEEGNVGH